MFHVEQCSNIIVMHGLLQKTSCTGNKGGILQRKLQRRYCHAPITVATPLPCTDHCGDATKKPQSANSQRMFHMEHLQPRIFARQKLVRASLHNSIVRFPEMFHVEHHPRKKTNSTPISAGETPEMRPA